MKRKRASNTTPPTTRSKTRASKLASPSTPIPKQDKPNPNGGGKRNTEERPPARSNRGKRDREVSIDWDNGDRYVGEIKERLCHGRGVYTWSNGARYDGEWEMGARHGDGKYTSKEGKVYEGRWKQNQKHGHGVETGGDGFRQFQGQFSHGYRHGYGCSFFEKSEKARYKGNWVNNVIDGKGDMFSKDGKLKYSGFWKCGFRHGKGELFNSKGEKLYEGEFASGMKEGRGKLLFPSGSSYDGQFKQDRFHGQGEYKWADGSVYNGGWCNDMRNGQGVYTWPNQMSYTGEWKNDMMHGKGTLRYPNELKEGEKEPKTNIPTWLVGNWCVDVKHGQFQELNEQGVVMKEDYYLNGIIVRRQGKTGIKRKREAEDPVRSVYIPALLGANVQYNPGELTGQPSTKRRKVD